MKKKVQKIVSLSLLLFTLFTTFAIAKNTEIKPMYTGITRLTSSIDIVSGIATCSGEVRVRGGYTVDLTVELKCDGNTVKTWTASGSGLFNTGGTYGVFSGHNYVVTTSAKVYDTNGNVIETPSKDSLKVSY